jgi:hypothetical protein
MRENDCNVTKVCWMCVYVPVCLYLYMKPDYGVSMWHMHICVRAARVCPCDHAHACLHMHAHTYVQLTIVHESSESKRAKFRHFNT